MKISEQINELYQYGKQVQELNKESQLFHQAAQIFYNQLLSINCPQKEISFIQKKVMELTDSQKKDQLSTFLKPLGLVLENGVDDIIVSKIDTKKSKNQIDGIVILDNLRSAHNVGAILRSCAFFGFKQIFFSGYTATPDNPKVQKTSLGCENMIHWEQKENTLKLIHELKAAGYHICALETASNAIILGKDKLPINPVFIFGNERDGLSQEVLREVDTIISIEGSGQKNSLNVATTAGICCFELYRQSRFKND